MTKYKCGHESYPVYDFMTTDQDQAIKDRVIVEFVKADSTKDAPKWMIEEFKKDKVWNRLMDISITLAREDERDRLAPHRDLQIQTLNEEIQSLKDKIIDKIKISEELREISEQKQEELFVLQELYHKQNKEISDAIRHKVQ